jgi:DNA-binding transcriptional regulator YiaG
MLRPIRDPMLVGAMLVGLGPGTHGLPFEATEPAVRTLVHTTAGTFMVSAPRASSGIAELRRMSGLTWEQLARLFKVSRRSLHFWAAGKAMNAGNEEHLQRILATVRAVDRGAASQNRAALVASHEGKIPFDLLTARQYDAVIALLGVGAGRREPPKVADAALRARAPRPPDELVDALQERVPTKSGPARAARSVRVRSGR